MKLFSIGKGSHAIKILHVVPTYLPASRYGGPIQSVHGLCRALAHNGHEVEVYTTNVDGAGVSGVPVAEPVKLDGVSVTYFPVTTPRRLYRSPGMSHALKQQISNFHLVHIHSMFLWPGLAASRYARKYRIPYVVSPRGMLVRELIRSKSRLAKSLWLGLFDRRMLRHASAIHVTSPQEASDLAQMRISVPALIELPNGVEAEFGDCTTESVQDEGFVFYIGRLHPKKGIEVLLESMQEVRTAQLLIAGDGEPDYVESLQQLVDRLGIHSRVRFLGHLADHQKWQYYRRASLLALPSVSENFGNVVLEAMACGCPVIVSPGVGLAGAVDKYQCGWVVERNPSVLGAAIQKLLASAVMRTQMGQNGAAAARAHFSWEVIARDMSQNYARIVNGDLIESGFGR